MAYANVTENAVLSYREGKLVAYSVADETTIYKGSLVFADASGAATYVPTGGRCFLGVAMESGTSGQLIKVAPVGVFPFITSSATAADVGLPVYLNTSANPRTVTKTNPTNSPIIGYITKVIDASTVEVMVTAGAIVPEGGS